MDGYMILKKKLALKLHNTWGGTFLQVTAPFNLKLNLIFIQELENDTLRGSYWDTQVIPRDIFDTHPTLGKIGSIQFTIKKMVNF